MQEAKQALGMCVRRAREAADLTQQQLADQLNIGLRTISDIEAGQANPEFATLYPIIKYLNISANDFFYPETSGVPVGTTSENLLARKQLLKQIMDCSDYEISIIKTTVESLLRTMRNSVAFLFSEKK